MSEKLYKVGVLDEICEKPDFSLDDNGHLSADYVKKLFSTDNKDLNAANILLSGEGTETISAAIDKKFDKTGGKIDGDLSVNNIFVSGDIKIDGQDVLTKAVADISYLSVTATAKDSEKLGGQVSSYYATKLCVDGLSDVYQKQSEMTAYATTESVSSKIVIGTGTYTEGATSATYTLQPNNLSVVKMVDIDYYRLVSDEKYDPNILYVLSSEQLNAYGERIIDVATPISATDAVNLSSVFKIIPVSIAAKTSIALETAPEIETILSADDSTFIQNLDHDSIVSVLLAFKKVFTSLASNS